MTLRTLLLWIILPVLLAGVVVYVLDDQEQAAGNTGKAGSEQAKHVGVYEVTRQTLEMTERIPGRVLAYRTAQIRPQVGGIIRERLFKEGSYVEEGQQLYQIDPNRFEADYQMAQANVETAAAELARATALEQRLAGLIDEKAVSEQEYDDAKAATQAAKAALARAKAEKRMAKINLGYTNVYAPISGYIGPSAVTEGALVDQNQQQPLAVIRQLDPVYVDLSQPSANAPDIKQRLIEARADEQAPERFDVTLFLKGQDAPYKHTGMIDATEQAVDEETGSIRLRAVVPNPDVVLLPGMFVEATVEDVSNRPVILIPQKTVTIQPSGEKAVWVVTQENTAEQRLIQTGQSVGNQWVVTDGLTPGERIVTDGAVHLNEGDQVRVSQQQPASDKQPAK